MIDTQAAAKNEPLAATSPAGADDDTARAPENGRSRPPLDGFVDETERRTALHKAHLAAGAEADELTGRKLPSSYGAPEEEHHAVRRRAGVFDLSHLAIVDVEGEVAEDWLRRLLSIDVARMDVGQARYACLCNEFGGVIDDPIVHRLGEHRWRLSGNAETRAKSLSVLEHRCVPGVALSVSTDLALLAVQGPEALALAGEALGRSRADTPDLAVLPRFGVVTDGSLSVARVGFSGEDGVEIALPADEAPALWAALLVAGVRPCGAIARETLRLEAGLPRHGVDLDEGHTPIECGLDDVVDFTDPTRTFVGRDVLAAQRAVVSGPGRIGLVLEGSGSLAAGQPVQLAGRDVGVVTSAVRSPTRQRSIALARVTRPIRRHCDVLVGGRPFGAVSVTLPFVRPGAALEDD